MTIPRHHLPAIGAATALLLALAPMPYGYYQLLRIAVTACALWLLLSSNGWRARSVWVKCVLIGITVLFNPLLPIHLSREFWAAIDPITAAMLLIVSFREQHS